MKKREQRTEELINGRFMQLFNEGKGVKEISEITKISMRTIYNSLQIIAEINGLAREDLLIRVNKPHIVTVKSVKAKKEVEASALLKECNELINQVGSAIKKIDNMLESMQ